MIPVIRWRIDIRAAVEHAFGRLREAWSALLLAAVAAALAWLITHEVMGHPQPFFAPIAAAISLSTSRIQRSKRIAQMVIGVLLGIAIGEVGASALGTSTLAIAVIVFVTFCVAVLAGAGFVGEGMMFANQAAASAILVVTVHRLGTGSERAIDALVGGGVALVLGTGLFPAQPLAILGDAERSVLATLARVLRRAALHAREQQPEEEWLLQAGGMIHAEIGALARARSTARANVRIAPRRWRLRTLVDAENHRTLQLHLMASAVLGLLRAVTMGPRPLPDRLEDQLLLLAGTLEQLAGTLQPWPQPLLERAHQTAAALRAYEDCHPGSMAPAILGSVATDIDHLTATPEEVSVTSARRP